MEKEPVKYEDKTLEPTIDEYIFLPLGKKVADLAYVLGLSPNQVTFGSTVFQLLASYFFFRDGPLKAVLMYLLGYILDSSDGVMARKYKMTSNFGEIFDLSSDFLTTAVLLLVFFLKSRKRKYFWHLFILLLVLLHLGNLWYGLVNAQTCLRKTGSDNYYEEKKKKLEGEKGFLKSFYLLYTKFSYRAYKRAYPTLASDSKRLKAEILSLRQYGPGNLVLVILFYLYFLGQ